MFATIYLPNFYLQAVLRHHPELNSKPIALIDDREKKAVIIQLNSVAEQNGVRCGMTPSQGLARSLDLLVKMRQLGQEKSLQEIMLDFAATLAPYVEATAPGIATIYFTDFKNLRAKIFGVIDQFHAAEIIAQAGIASTPDASFIAAHRGEPVLEIEDVNQFLAALPIETLLG
ncbi:MAG TPA: hypothetical protein VFQ43_04220 [Nitrososphaera sp.]|nr:hypothetical protein [Nitrososphaera sp.]